MARFHNIRNERDALETKLAELEEKNIEAEKHIEKLDNAGKEGLVMLENEVYATHEATKKAEGKIEVLEEHYADTKAALERAGKCIAM